MKKKVLFIHYRTGERDGVSLEIEKRAKIFKNQGCDIFYLTGFDPRKTTNIYNVDELNIKTTLSDFLRKTFFFEKVVSEEIQKHLYFDIEKLLIIKFTKVFKDIKPDLVCIHNVFSHGYNLPATTALIKVLDELKIKTLCVHHDFWFEREKFLFPKSPFIEDILKNIPPARDYIIKHQVINSLSKYALFEKRKISAEQIGDFFDFSQPLPTIDDFNKDLLDRFDISKNDLVILQATRITPRKAIENAIMFCKLFKDRIVKDNLKLSINNKLVNKDTNIVLLCSNFIEVDDKIYAEKLNDLSISLGIRTIFAGDFFNPIRLNSPIKQYSFWDAYVFSDLITYPSVWEGFGNQLLEAIHFKKIPILFEYPVFEADLKKEGYEYISLGNKYITKDNFFLFPKENINKAIQQLITLLDSKIKVNNLINKNLQIASLNHGESLLTNDIVDILSHL